MLLQILVFVAWFCACVAMIPYIDIGLDQSLSMPEVRLFTITLLLFSYVCA